MAIIAMRNPVFERAFGSIAAVIRVPAKAVIRAMAPIKAVGESMTSALAASGGNLAAIKRKESTK